MKKSSLALVIAAVVLATLAAAHAGQSDSSSRGAKLSGHVSTSQLGRYSAQLTRLNGGRPIIDSQRLSGSYGSSVFTYNYNVAVVPGPVRKPLFLVLSVVQHHTFQGINGLHCANKLISGDNYAGLSSGKPPDQNAKLDRALGPV